MDPCLSVCLIVKDEAQDLAACLASVQGIADEIIVVDTGSSDGSQDIAQHFGAQVFEQDWQDDFAQARNHSLAQAQGKWILVIDADETLDPDSARQIQSRLASLEPALWMAQVINYGQEDDQYIFPVVRLFPRSAELSYSNPFHEILIDSSARLGIRSAAWLSIHHKGYQDSPQRRLKHERNHRILKQLVAQEPNNPLWHIHLANYLYNHGPEMAITWKHYQTALTLAEQTPDFKNNPTYQGCVTELLWVCYQQQQTHMGLLLAQSQQHWCQHLPEYWYHRGLLQRQNTSYAAAIASFQACLQFKAAQLEGIRYQVAHLQALPLFQMALTYRGWWHHPDTPAQDRERLRLDTQAAIARALRHQALPLEQGLLWLVETLSTASELDTLLSEPHRLAPATQSAREVLLLLAAVSKAQISPEQLFAQVQQDTQAPLDFKSSLLLKSYAFRFHSLEAFLLLSQVQQKSQQQQAAAQTLTEALLFHPFEPRLHLALKKLN